MVSVGGMNILLEELRRWDVERLARLLRLRPALMAATSLERLARAVSSTAFEAVQDLPSPQRQVLEAVSLLAQPVTVEDLGLLDPGHDVQAELHLVVADLQDRFLLQPGDPVLRTVGPLAQFLQHPLGFGRHVDAAHEQISYYELCDLVQAFGRPRPKSRAEGLSALRAAFSDTEVLRELLEQLPDDARALLERVDRDGPLIGFPGVDPYQRLLPEDDGLLALVTSGLLAVVGVGRVEIPFEVGLALRRPTITTWRLSGPLPGVPVDQDQVDAACGVALVELLDGVNALMRRLDAAPAALLTSGALGIKELRALAAEVGEPSTCALLLALLDQLGLVTKTRKDLRPTSAWAAWSQQGEAERWTDLVRAWLALVDLPASRPGSPRRLKAPLSFAYDPRAPRDRLRALRLLSSSPADTSYDGLAWLDSWTWRWAPARLTAYDAAGRLPDQELRADVLHEAELLALLADGAATPLVRALHGDVAAAIGRLAAAGASSVRAQADMTLVCTGTPSRRLRAALNRLASVEQSGRATVWRLSEQSLSVAYDEGDGPAEVLAVLERYAGTLPQAMAYLVGDAHRRHGRVRVGAASSYVVVEDDALLTEALGSKGNAAGVKGLRELGLRRVAPGVAVSRGSVSATVEALRLLGVPAVTDAAVEAAVPAAARARRSTPPRRQPLPAVPPLDVSDRAAAHARALLG